MGLLGEICSAVEARYLQLKGGSLKKINDEYLNLLYLKDQWASFKFDGRIQNGKIIGITDIGQLILKTENETRVFNTNEIEFLN